MHLYRVAKEVWFKVYNCKYACHRIRYGCIVLFILYDIKVEHDNALDCTCHMLNHFLI